MSQPDFIRELRGARPSAPAELRERVRLVAAQASPPPRRLVTWRRAALVLVPAVAAAIAAAVFLPGGSHQMTTAEREAVIAQNRIDKLGVASSTAPTFHSAAPAPNAHRYQYYNASLELRVRDAGGVSDGARRATAIANSLSGYTQSTNLDAGGHSGYADIVLRVPIAHVQQAVRELSALGTVIGEHFSVSDVTAKVNATERLIASLQRQLADLRTRYQDTRTQRQEDALAARIRSLQRGNAGTIRQAHYATVNLQLTTATPPPVKHPGHGPLHGIGVAFRWIGIGLVYALAFGAPLAALATLGWLAARTVRRRREEALLSRP